MNAFGAGNSTASFGGSLSLDFAAISVNPGTLANGTEIRLFSNAASPAQYLEFQPSTGNLVVPEPMQMVFVAGGVQGVPPAAAFLSGRRFSTCGPRR